MVLLEPRQRDITQLAGVHVLGKGWYLDKVWESSNWSGRDDGWEKVFHEMEQRV